MTPAPDGPPTSQSPPRPTRRRWGQWAGWAAVAIATVLALSQCTVLVRRAGRGKTDFSVIYRTAEAINRGEDGDLYARPHDPKWPRSIPPVGTAPFQVLATMPPATAAVVWCVATLAILAGGAVCMTLIVKRLGPQAADYRTALPWALAVLIALACDSIQTGQFSILFAACWLAFMLAAIHRRHAWAGLALALPAAIKFYPALLLAVPLALRKGRQVLLFAVGWIALTVVVPVCAVGPAKAWDLSAAYVRHNFLADANVVNVRFHAATISNQAIDVVLLRYLTGDPEFHATANMPHLDLPRTLALGLAQAVRGAILALAAVATWRWLRKADPAAPLTLVMLTALWTATLYLVLPETKARYAVYTAPAYLPILAALAAAARQKHYRATALLIILVAASLAALIDLPRPLLHLGAGLAGPLILFSTTLALMKRTDWLTHEHHA